MTACVVLDTNIWRSELLLRTPVGAALLFYLQRGHGLLGLPEVIEMELGHQVMRAGREASEAATQSFRTLQQILGAMPEFQLPSDEQLEAAVPRRLEELRGLLHRTPFTHQHARSALFRVDSATPPNSPKNQQFKDSAIWEAILELGSTFEVLFVTADKGFFKSRDIAAGLAPELYTELEQAALTVEVVPAMKDCLAKLQKSVPPLDTERLTNLLDETLRPELAQVLGRQQFALGPRVSGNLMAHATENHVRIALLFELLHRLDEVGANGRSEAVVSSEGDAEYDIQAGRIAQYRFNKITTRWLTPEGVVTEAKHAFASLSGAIGHRTLPLVIRKELS